MMVLFSGADNELVLAGFGCGTTLGSSQPELKKTLLSELKLDTWFISKGPRRYNSYFVITPVAKSKSQIKAKENMLTARILSQISISTWRLNFKLLLPGERLRFTSSSCLEQTYNELTKYINLSDLRYAGI